MSKRAGVMEKEASKERETRRVERCARFMPKGMACMVREGLQAMCRSRAWIPVAAVSRKSRKIVRTLTILMSVSHRLRLSQDT